jgi:hypothetical protein
MNNFSQERPACGRQPTAWADARWVAPNNGIYSILAPGLLPNRTYLLTAGDLEKRLGDVVRRARPGRRNVSEDEFFPQAGPLTPEQQDYVAWQQARDAVQSEARQNRRGHTRFQELWRVALRREAELDTNPVLRIHLNPIRAWARFVTPLLLGMADLPSDVLFFPAGDAIRTVLLRPKARALLNVLSSCSPCTVRQYWLLNKHSGRNEIVQFSRHLAQVGLVAFG